MTIAIGEEFGWRCFTGKSVKVWTKGYGRICDGDALARKLTRMGERPSVGDVEKVISSLDGHFALVAQGPGWTVAAVDPVRSIPVAYGAGSRGWVIDDQAERLRLHLGLSAGDVDAGAALALAMSGYTIDAATLYQSVQQIGPGEFVLFRQGETPQRRRYYCYRPWRADKPSYSPEKARTALAEIILELIDGMMQGVGDRILAVPLSAGRDSRLIVSAAKHLGYKNIRTFAYGRKNNHEAKASQAIAERLGYDWRFVVTDTAFMRRYFASTDWQQYLRFSDTLQSTPFVQDLPQIQMLKTQGYIPGDAVIANGNSGDFISGNHIVPPMDAVSDSETPRARKERITQTLCMKHFALWSELRSEAREQGIRSALWDSIERAGGALGDPENDYGLYEYAEFQDRQCKYVISGQRIYEFLGHDWRLPLWDRVLLDFFEAVPLEGKTGQRLYREMLEAENWGGVWRGVPVNREVIKPDWVRPLRWIAKAAHAPFGREAWHRFEKRYFQYWMELGGQSAIRGYRDIIRDRRGPRHGVAWLTEAYLAHHGLGFDGKPMERNG